MWDAKHRVLSQPIHNTPSVYATDKLANSAILLCRDLQTDITLDFAIHFDRKALN
jgi:hypothetical protein